MKDGCVVNPGEMKNIEALSVNCQQQFMESVARQMIIQVSLKVFVSHIHPSVAKL